MDEKLQNLKILIVDDEPDLLDAISINLELMGAVVTTANNGLQGLEQLKKGEFDIILSDIRMPECDGVEFLKSAKEEFKQIPPFFFLTGFSDYSTETIQRLGANELVSKPFQVGELVELILKHTSKSA